MDDQMKDVVVGLAVLFGIPGGVGAFFARNRGRSIAGWGLLCAVVPFFLVVLYFKKPLREVRGAFRRCPFCGEYVGWRKTTCRYCGGAVSGGEPPGG